MHVRKVLETVLYVPDLDAARSFYADVLGLEPFATAEGRHLFYMLDGQVFLLFEPRATQEPPRDPRMPVPPHGAIGEGHVCFAASAAEIDGWVEQLGEKGFPIEADFAWPQGRRSIYFRDPGGNCLEFAEPRIWGLEP